MKAQRELVWEGVNAKVVSYTNLAGILESYCGLWRYEGRSWINGRTFKGTEKEAAIEWAKSMDVHCERGQEVNQGRCSECAADGCELR